MQRRWCCPESKAGRTGRIPPRKAELHPGRRRRTLARHGAGEAQVADPTEGPLFPGLIVRESQPLNLECPFATLDRFLTPNERFFVRATFRSRPWTRPAGG